MKKLKMKFPDHWMKGELEFLAEWGKTEEIREEAKKELRKNEKLR